MITDAQLAARMGDLMAILGVLNVIVLLLSRPKKPK